MNPFPCIYIDFLPLFFMLFSLIALSITYGLKLQIMDFVQLDFSNAFFLCIVRATEIHKICALKMICFRFFFYLFFTVVTTIVFRHSRSCRTQRKINKNLYKSDSRTTISIRRAIKKKEQRYKNIEVYITPTILYERSYNYDRSIRSCLVNQQKEGKKLCKQTKQQTIY